MTDLHTLAQALFALDQGHSSDAFVAEWRALPEVTQGFYLHKAEVFRGFVETIERRRCRKADLKRDQQADAAFGPWPFETSEDLQLLRVECKQAGYELIPQADALALWAVRVLDALHRKLVAEHGAFGQGSSAPHVVALSTCRFTMVWWGSGAYKIGDHATEDAARLAAADAVFGELPADVQAKLRRPK